MLRHLNIRLNLLRRYIKDQQAITDSVHNRDSYGDSNNNVAVNIRVYYYIRFAGGSLDSS